MVEDENRFEKDLADTLGGLMRKHDDICIEVWSALANVNWYHPETNSFYSASFRSGGGLVAEISGKGDYMTWYCSGPYATVSNLVAMRMKKRGWIADALPTPCDEPNCFKPAGCGWNDGENRRYTCGEHMGEHRPSATPPIKGKE